MMPLCRLLGRPDSDAYGDSPATIADTLAFSFVVEAQSSLLGVAREILP